MRNHKRNITIASLAAIFAITSSSLTAFAGDATIRVDKNKKIEKKLRKAARKGDLSTIKALLSENPTVTLDGQAGNGDTALIESVWHHNVDVANYLIANGADPNLSDNLGRTALLWAVDGQKSTSKEESKQLVKGLLDAGANPSGGRVGVMGTALCKSDVDLINTLIDRGANTKFTFNDGGTYLHRVAFCRKKADKFEIIGTLLDKGVDPKKRAKGETFVDYIAKSAPAMDEAALISLEQAMPGLRKEYKEAKAQQDRIKAALASPRSKLQCATVRIENMSDEQGQAVQYLIQKSQQGRVQVLREGWDYCVESVRAVQKIPLRGNTVIKYEQMRFYPRGFNKAMCEKYGWPDGTIPSVGMIERYTGCLQTNPIEAGGRRRVSGEVEI